MYQHTVNSLSHKSASVFFRRSGKAELQLRMSPVSDNEANQALRHSVVPPKRFSGSEDMHNSVNADLRSRFQGRPTRQPTPRIHPNLDDGPTPHVRSASPRFAVQRYPSPWP